MAYGVRYYTTYKRRSGGTTTIQILERNYSSSSTQLRADANPLTITTTGNGNNIYTPTLGSGAVIRLLVTPLTFHSLFFVTDPQKLMVKVFSGSTSESPIWQGFVSTGIYSEDYSEATLTPIQLQCNDGMALLDDIPYVSNISGGTRYSGFTEIYQVMSNIFSKLGISFNEIRTANDLKIADYTYNPFLYLTVNNENYYDEQGNPMSCREVLNSIWGAMGLVMSFRGSVIYIIDPINLHTASKGKTFATSPAYGASETAKSLGGYLDISDDDINWYETGQMLDVTQEFNQIDIKYDPFNFTQYMYEFQKEDNIINDNAVAVDYGSYKIYKGIEMVGWNITATNKIEGWQQTGNTTIEYMIRQDDVGTGYYAYTFPFSNIKQDENLRLQVSMDLYVNTKDDNDLWSEAEGTTVNEIKIPIYIKVGNQWYGGNNVWQTGQTYTTMTIRTPNSNVVEKFVSEGILWWKHTETLSIDESEINDMWTTTSVIIDMGQSYAENLISGSIYIYIPKAMNLLDVTPAPAESSIKNLLIKNIGVQTVSENLIPIGNNGVNTRASLTNNYSLKKSPLEIKLKNGIGTYGCSKGAFSTMQQVVAGINIVGLARSGSSTYYDTAELLAQSLISQYSVPRMKLKGSLDVSDYLLDIQNYLIKDSTYLNTKAFYIINGNYDDEKECFDCEMIEITNTRESL